MGVFDKNYEKSYDDLYENIKSYLGKKNGKKQVILINTTSKSTTNGMDCDNKYTLQINGILEEMQNE